MPGARWDVFEPEPEEALRDRGAGKNTGTWAGPPPFASLPLREVRVQSGVSGGPTWLQVGEYS